MQQTSTIQPRKGHQTDKYQGGIHPTSKLRHGKGTYSYDNPFFSFQGAYVNGKKNGPGRLSFKDGRVISATFVEDEMVGQAEIAYPDGGRYNGWLNYGQKEGQGVYVSSFERYEGEWKDNCKHGIGKYQNFSTGEQYEGQFSKNHPHGKGKIARWNYEYEGDFQSGKREGEGREVSDWMKDEENPLGRYEYIGSFKDNKFHGIGTFKSKDTSYTYTGDFQAAQPILYPNEFRLFLTNNTKSGQDLVQSQKTLLAAGIDYELQGDSFNLYIETVYQGPQVLDENQPTQEQIDTMIKNWQAENKKNKNPPPMPDFSQPRMKKPQMVVVQEETGRPIQLRLIRQADGKEESLKIDYRNEIIAKRRENEQLKLEAARKAEQEGNKKGGKKDNKGEAELKVNLYKEHASPKERVLHVKTEQGRSQVMKMELPDDFPQGKYWLEVRSAFGGFGEVRVGRKEWVVRGKQVQKKK